MNPAEARRGLAADVSREDWITQQGFLAAFIVACAAGDVELIRATLKDVIIEPQRADSVRCFPDVRDAALASGALGCSLSGSGPSVFALAETGEAVAVKSAMERACRALGIECQAWTSPMTAPGARMER